MNRSMLERLRRKPAGAYVPPPPAPPGSPPSPIANVQTPDYESGVFVAELGLNGLVGQTTRPWRGIDVYVSPNPGDLTVRGVLSIFVHAVSNNVRTLVASGRVIFTPQSQDPAIPPATKAVWAASARSVAERFEVSTAWRQFSALNQQAGSATITFTASNQAADAPPNVGEAPFAMVTNDASQAVTSLGFAGLPIVGELELRSIYASYGPIATTPPRWLHVHDTLSASIAEVTGFAPLFVLPLTTEGLVAQLSYRSRGFLVLVTSSTLLTTTITTDCAMQAMVR